MTESINSYPNSLLREEFRGGDIAETGFTFQDNLILASIPGWLSRQSFTSMIREATCDYEALFFYPSAGGYHRLGVECKGQCVPPKVFWDELGNFREIDSRNPGAYSRFLIQSTGVGEKLKPVLEALRRVRGAWPFYDHGAPAVQLDSYAQYEKIVINANRSEDEARFLFDKVEVEWYQSIEEEAGLTRFIQQLQKHFPTTLEASGRELRDAALRVRALLKSRKAKPILRHELENAIWSEMHERARPDLSSLTIFTSHDDASWAGANTDSLIFDWRPFFGGAERLYPATDMWIARALREISACKDWIEAQNRPRRIQIDGYRRNSSEFAVGSIFRSAAGFILQKEQKDKIWSTDQHADTSTPDYTWDVTVQHQAVTSELAVAIVVQGNGSVSSSFAAALQEQTGQDIALLGLSASDPFVSAAQVNLAVQRAKNEVLKAIESTGARTIRLYLWCPAVLALFLGHRFNLEADVVCYEKDGNGRYVPTWQL